jgi:hypothetical protein
MGAWGEDVFDNDYVMDTMHDLKTMPLPQFIEKCLKSDEYDVRGGAAVFVLTYPLLEAEIMDDLWLEETKSQFIDKLAAISISEWIEDWRDPDSVRDLIKGEIAKLEAL